MNTIQRGGSRLYVHPRPDRGKNPGVTSVLNKLPKDFLKFWAAKSVAENAVKLLPEVVGLAMKDPQAAIDMLKRSPDRDTKRAADMGTEVHELYERLARGEAIVRVHPDLEPYLRHWHEFVARFKPRFLHLEETVWSDTHGYAGSFDFIAEVDGEIAIGDFKTTRSGVHEEVALQLSAYRHADCIVGEDGEDIPLPKITAGMVLHVRPEGWQVVPVKCDEEVFAYFLHLRKVYDWDREVKGSVLGRPIKGEAAS